MDELRNANQERDVAERIRVLGVVTPEQDAELESIFSHTRWQLCLVHSVAEAVEAIRSLPTSVILCEQKLSDGTWMDLIDASAQLGTRPQIIVLSATADVELWAEVLNCGGYDLLARPLRATEIYDVVPMAWRQSDGLPWRNSDVIDKTSIRALIQAR